ncbi:MAG TPA: biopolymer transporter ExbD [Planctomycetaceae bacterium]|nr:biopolymer transporter ExbD [Planctomycetaceae bacterium]
MLIEFECVSCGKPLAVPETAAGRKARCPHCRTTFAVPNGELNEDEDDDEDHEDEGIHKPPRKEYHDLVDMTAMVDIVFFLLIFFLMTSLYTLKPAIPMPPTEQSGSSGAVSMSADADRDEVVVRIDEKDVVYVDEVAMPTAHDLKDKLDDIVRSGGPTTLKITGSPDATHGTLVMIMDAGAGAGMQKVQLSIKSTEDF